MRSLLLLVSLALVGPASGGPVLAQQAGRVATREVNIEVLVKDKQTGLSVADLTRENFEVFENGKTRELSHFSRAGDLRARPLALVLVLDLWPSGAGRYLRQPGFTDSLAAALIKLSPEDEIAVLATSVDGVRGKQQWLTKLTRNRSEVAAALASAPKLVGDNQLVEKEYADYFGTLVKEIARLASERPDSQVVLVMSSDGMNSLDTIHLADRNKTATELLRGNLVFSALAYDLSGKKKALVAASKPLFVLTRTSVTGNNQHFAKVTGGEALQVETPEEYVKGLEDIVGSLAARYSLGFTRGEGDINDEKMRELEIRVTARDSSGKKRKLQVHARRGYYLPKN